MTSLLVYQVGGFEWARGNFFLMRSGTTSLGFYCSDADAIDLFTIIVTLIILCSFACKEIRVNPMKCEKLCVHSCTLGHEVSFGKRLMYSKFPLEKNLGQYVDFHN